MKKMSTTTEIWLMERAKEVFGATNPSDSVLTIRPVEFPVSALRWPVHSLVEERVTKTSKLVRDYFRENVPPFAAAFSVHQLSIPIFVIRDGSSFVIVDGAHRAFAALPFANSLYGWMWSIQGKYPPFPYETFRSKQLQIIQSVATWQERFRWRKDVSTFVNFTKVTDALSQESPP